MFVIEYNNLTWGPFDTAEDASFWARRYATSLGRWVITPLQKGNSRSELEAADAIRAKKSLEEKIETLQKQVRELMQSRDAPRPKRVAA